MDTHSQQPGGENPTNRLLVVLLAVSLLTNIILLVRLKQPGAGDPPRGPSAG